MQTITSTELASYLVENGKLRATNAEILRRAETKFGVRFLDLLMVVAEPVAGQRQAILVLGEDDARKLAKSFKQYLSMQEFYAMSKRTAHGLIRSERMTKELENFKRLAGLSKEAAEAAVSCAKEAWRLECANEMVKLENVVDKAVFERLDDAITQGVLDSELVDYRFGEYWIAKSALPELIYKTFVREL